MGFSLSVRVIPRCPSIREYVLRCCEEFSGDSVSSVYAISRFKACSRDLWLSGWQRWVPSCCVDVEALFFTMYFWLMRFLISSGMFLLIITVLKFRSRALLMSCLSAWMTSAIFFWWSSSGWAVGFVFESSWISASRLSSFPVSRLGGLRWVHPWTVSRDCEQTISAMFEYP